MAKQRSVFRTARLVASLALALMGIGSSASAAGGPGEASDPAITRVDAIRAALLATQGQEQPQGTESAGKRIQTVQRWRDYWPNYWRNFWRNW